MRVRCGVLPATWPVSLPFWAPGLITSPRAQEAFDASQLVGSAIKASVTNLQSGIKNGRKFQSPLKQDWTIELQANNTLRVTFSATASTPKGNITRGPQTFVQQLEIPAKAAVPRGGGDAVWFFDDNVLTNLRTYEGGAQRATFAVTRTGADLRCSATVVWPKEVGVPTIKLRSLVDNAKVEIVSAKQTSSSCRIVKKN